MLFHGALFELALFEIKQDDSSVVEIDASDTILLALSDVLAPIIPQIDVSDSIVLNVSDLVSEMFGSVSATDAVDVLISDIAAVAAIVNASDTALVAIADSLAALLVSLGVSDAALVEIDEAPGDVSAVVDSSDDISVLLDDALEIFGDVAASDALTLAVFDALTLVKRLPPRSAIGRVASGGVSGKLKGVRPYGSVGSGRTRGYVG